MGEKSTFTVRNHFPEKSGIYIICWNLGSTIALQEVPPGTPSKEIETEEGLKRFFKLYVLTRKRKGLPPQPYFGVTGSCGHIRRRR